MDKFCFVKSSVCFKMYERKFFSLVQARVKELVNIFKKIDTLALE